MHSSSKIFSATILSGALLYSLCGCLPKQSASINQATVSGTQSRTALVGKFLLKWDETQNSIEVFHSKEPTRSLWKSSSAQKFFEIAADSTSFEQVRGSITVQEHFQKICDNSSITNVVSSSTQLTIHGHLDGNCQARNFSISFLPASENTLKFEAKISQNFGQKIRTFLRYQSTPNEGFFGFGEQYSEFNMKGKRLPILIQEQGHGRGLQPLSTAINIASKGSAGDWHTSYAPVPQYLSLIHI